MGTTAVPHYSRAVWGAMRLLPRRRCAPSPACGGGLGWGCFRNGDSQCGKSPHPARRADVPRKRERLTEPTTQSIQPKAIPLAGASLVG
jgi:hypothetical protein